MRLCSRQKAFEQECAKHINQLPLHLQGLFQMHVKDYQTRCTSIKYLLSNLSAQQYVIEDCKYLHVRKYNIEDVTDSNYDCGAKDNTIVHNIQPLEQRSYYENNTTKKTKTTNRTPLLPSCRDQMCRFVCLCND